MAKKQKFVSNRSIFGSVTVHVRTKRTVMCAERKASRKPGPCVVIKPVTA